MFTRWYCPGHKCPLETASHKLHIKKNISGIYHNFVSGNTLLFVNTGNIGKTLNWKYFHVKTSVEFCFVLNTNIRIASRTRAPRTRAPRTRAPRTRAPRTRAPRTRAPRTRTHALHHAHRIMRIASCAGTSHHAHRSTLTRIASRARASHHVHTHRIMRRHTTSRAPQHAHAHRIMRTHIASRARASHHAHRITCMRNTRVHERAHTHV